MSFTCRGLIVKNRDKYLLDISFNVQKSFALIGQSGSGKSLTLKAILGMLPNSLEYSLDINGGYKFERGKTISFVPQNPFTALSPLTKINKQFFIKKMRLKNM